MTRLRTSDRTPLGLPGWTLLVAVVLGGIGLAGRPAHAEPYAGVFLGSAFTTDKTNATRLSLNDSPFLEGKFRDVEIHTSPLAGLKAGYFFATRPVLGGHLGAELEFQYTHPEASRQTVTFSGTFMGAPSTFETSIQYVDFEVYALLLSALYRFPLLAGNEFPYGRVQPYAGLGVGGFVATMHTRTTPLDVNRLIHDTDVEPGLQVLGGVKVFVLRNVALFVEYRFAQTTKFTFDFEERGTVGGMPVTETARDRADLTQHQAAFGLAVHW